MRLRGCASESGETLIELILALTIVAAVGTVFLGALFTATVSARTQTADAHTNALLTTWAERATTVPYVPCATPDEYEQEIKDQLAALPEADRLIVPGIHVVEVAEWDAGARRYLPASTCPSGQPGGQHLQRLTLSMTSPTGGEQRAAVAKRGPLNIPTLVAGPRPGLGAVASGAPDPPVVGDGTLIDRVQLHGDKAGTGTITFKLFAPSQFIDGACTGAPMASSTRNVDASDPDLTTYASDTVSMPATAEAGTYRWIASYSGDAANQPLTTLCDDPLQTIDVAPGIELTALPASAGVGAELRARAELLGTQDAGGHVAFSVFDDAACSHRVFGPVDVSLAQDAAEIAAGSGYTPSATGTYRWKATYSGDGGYLGGTTTACETATVDVRHVTTLSITPDQTAATVPAPIGASATLAGGSTPTGTLTIRLYGNGTCAGSPTQAFSHDVATSPTATATLDPSTSGTYSWDAHYDGDAGNAPADAGCSAPVTVS